MKRHSMENEAIIEKEEKGKKEENINKEEILRKLETEGKAVVETFAAERSLLRQMSRSEERRVGKECAA